MRMLDLPSGCTSCTINGEHGGKRQVKSRMGFWSVMLMLSRICS